MNKLILMILLGSLLACNQKSENLINIDDIPLTDSIKGHAITIPNQLFMPTKLFAINDLLVVYDAGKESGLFSVYKLPELEYLHSFGNKGKGPGEFMSIDDNSFQLRNNELIFLDNYHIHYMELSSEYMRLRKSIPIRNEGQPTNRLKILNDSLYISDIFPEPGSNLEHQLINLNNLKIFKEFGQYPSENIVFEKLADRYNAYLKALAIHPDGNLIASFYLHFNRMRLYNFFGELISDITIDNNNGEFNSRNRKGNIIYRVEPFATNDYIFVLKIGKSKTEIEKDIASFQPQLEKWNWEGKILERYQLDHPIISFAICPENNKIYGTSFLELNKIYEFQLPQPPNNSKSTNKEKTKEFKNNIYEMRLPIDWLFSMTTPEHEKDKFHESGDLLINWNNFGKSYDDKCGASIDIRVIKNIKPNELLITKFLPDDKSVLNLNNDTIKMDQRLVLIATYKLHNSQEISYHEWIWQENEFIIKIQFASCNQYEAYLDIITECVKTFTLL